MRESEEFYVLTVQDIQNVAAESVSRRLTDHELDIVIPQIEARIAWYETIEDVIRESIKGDNQ